MKNTIKEELKSSIPIIQAELEWLKVLIDFRLKDYFENTGNADVECLPPPDLGTDSAYGRIITEFSFSFSERVVLIMALAVHISPSIYDLFFMKDVNLDRGFTVFGGVTGKSHNGFIPTGETAAFILGGRDLQKRFALLDLFSDDHFFHKQNMLYLNAVEDDEPVFNGVLTISKEYLSLLAQGKTYTPQYTSAFPARLLTTDLSWSDAVYDPHTLSALEEAKVWIEYGEEIMKHELIGKHLKNGYRILFYGAPGTGKTMTAALLGKESGREVYQIDLSALVSKYVGETEKNLGRVFDLAENKSWILFFDEADALFGKRTQVRSSNDQFANQQVAYLLQRIEDFNGIVILASNLKENIDTAFLRRFQLNVLFPKPGIKQRLELWQNYFSHSFDLVDVDIDHIAGEYEITGGGIINVLRYCAIAAKARNSSKLYLSDIQKGINREYHKEGITI